MYSLTTSYTTKNTLLQVAQGKHEDQNLQESIFSPTKKIKKQKIHLPSKK